MVRRESQKLCGLVEPFFRNTSHIFDKKTLGFFQNRGSPKNSRGGKTTQQGLIYGHRMAINYLSIFQNRRSTKNSRGGSLLILQ